MTENNINDTPSFFIEKDVLGLEKTKIQNKFKIKKSKWLYISFAIFIVISLIIIFFIDSREVEYYPNSNKILTRGNFTKVQEKDGSITSLQHGKWTYYFENGKKSAERQFKKGTLSGLNTEWYDNGVMRVRNFYIDDSIDGKVKSWWRNGKIFTELDMKNNKADGKYIQWDSLGNLITYKIFKDGKLIKIIK